MKKILLFDTAIATTNLGDEIIFNNVCNGLDPIIHNAAIYRMGTHIQNYSSLQMLLHKYIYADEKIRSICEQADFKFVCGTNLLVNNLFRPRAQFMLNKFNKMLYDGAVLVGVGRSTDFNRFKNRYTERLYKNTLSHNYIHSVRDEQTKAIVEYLGFEAINTGCPTLWMMDHDKCLKIPRKKAENVIFSVSGYASQSDPIKDLEMIRCLKNNYHILYAWIQTSVDEEYLNKIIASSHENFKIKFIYSIKAFDEILSTKNVDYVGTRLHGGIYAMQNNIRSLIVSVDERARGFHESNNIPIIERENITSLENIINSEFETDIKLNYKNIEKFLKQFM